MLTSLVPTSSYSPRFAFIVVYTTLVGLVAAEITLYYFSCLSAKLYLASNIAKVALSLTAWLLCVLGPLFVAALIVGPATSIGPPPILLLLLALLLFVLAQ